VQVVLLRHATRDLQSADDGKLSEHGFRQAEELIAKIAPNGPLPEPSVLIASPKRRARETLHPVAASLSIPLVVSSSLDERHPDETGSMFATRIQNWVGSLSKDFASDEVIWACSHADWLEFIMDFIPSDLDEWEKLAPFSPAQFRVFEIVDGVWKKAK
jgi:broad specificity phosphatase PhoE